MKLQWLLLLVCVAVGIANLYFGNIAIGIADLLAATIVAVGRRSAHR